MWTASSASPILCLCHLLLMMRSPCPRSPSCSRMSGWYVVVEGEGGPRERETERERERVRARERRRRRLWPCSPSCLRKPVWYVVVRGGRARARDRECARERKRDGSAPYVTARNVAWGSPDCTLSWVGGQAREREGEIESACARKTEKERERRSPCHLLPSCFRMSVWNVVGGVWEERERQKERASARVTWCCGRGDRTRESQR